MKRITRFSCRGCGGYTLTELVVASSVTITVVAATLSIYVGIFQSWSGVELRMQADRDVNMAMSRMLYGVDSRRGIRAATELTLTSNTSGWTAKYVTAGEPPQTNSFTYSETANTLVFNPGSKIVGTDITYAKAYLQAHSLVVTMRVDRVSGRLGVRREIGTEIAWRN